MKRKIRRWVAYLFIQALILFTRLMPRQRGLAFFAFLGGVAHRSYRKDFIALARNAYDALRLIYLPKGKILRLCAVEGEEHLAGALRSGRGIIGLTGHIGCWELLAAYFSSKGYPVSVIYRDMKDERLESLLVGMRRRHGVTSIPRGASALSAYKALKRGEILAMLIDQDIDVDGLFVPFFGVPAHTPRGAAAFALRSGAAIVPLAIHMQPDGSHRVTVLPELEKPSADLPEGERIDELTRSCARAVEGLIRIYPQQWVWFHDRWRKGEQVS
ncbi:MAG: lysophospholipid acyltransferase family protein [Candidatus Krumholzibacteria bacterium]|nr:lysophospholipid acyltransferase family protein [Candidatus Krumholzibacteria bacterium]